MIYLDNAATSGKKPRQVVQAVATALQELSVNPGRGGYELSRKGAQLLYDTRKAAQAFFNADHPGQVVFTPGCTYAINYTLKGVLAPGDHVVTSSVEHNAVVRPLEALRARGVKYDVAEVLFGDSEATLRSFARALQPNTRLVICTHASNVTGEMLPIAAIGELCRQKGILFAVDAAQTAGVLPIDMQKMHIDFLCVAPHKGLLAPMGVGLLVARKGLPFTVIEGGTGTASVLPTPPTDLPERLESGTVNLPGIAGLRAGLQFVQQKTPVALYRHEQQLCRQAYAALEKLSGIQLYSPDPRQTDCAPLLCFGVQGVPAEQVAAFLGQKGIAVRGGLHCAPWVHKRLGTIDTGTVRVSPGWFNTPEDIRRCIAALQGVKA